MSNDGEPEMAKPEVFLTALMQEERQCPLCFISLLERQSVALFIY